MRILITGARDWPAELESVVHNELMAALVAAHRAGEILTVVNGACPTGADAMATHWALLHGVPLEEHPADWERHGRAAGPIRNRQMVEAGADRCVAFLLPHSRGTKHCTDLAEEAGIPTRRIRPDGRERGGAA